MAEAKQREHDSKNTPSSKIKGKALFKRHVVKTMFVNRLAKKDTVEGMVAEITGAVATHWEEYQTFFIFASMQALVITFLIAGFTVGAQNS